MKWLRLSLLQKIWLSTSVALMVMFAVTGIVLQRHTLQTTNQSLREEVQASFRAYESLWKSRSETLASVSAILSGMPNVRAAFQTRHRPTIKDVAGEWWDKIADEMHETAFFVVADPDGATIASLDPAGATGTPTSWPVVKTVRNRFPKQISGFALLNNQLYQLVLTPVYIDSGARRDVISVLITGYVVNHLIASRLKESTGGSEFLFLSGDRVFASTLNERATGVLQRRLASARDLVSDGVSEYTPLVTPLVDLESRPLGTLYILRSFDAARQRINGLQQWLFLIWLCAVTAGLGVSYLLARRIIQPVALLDRAAGEVAHQNYGFRVPVTSNDELGRLARTFNEMCQSLLAARQELIRQERISTIGQMASSIVHDLRNPLAAIYGGAEMMVDTELTPAQVKRVALNIYKSSQRIQEMLQDLLQVTRGKRGQKESCSLLDVIEAGIGPMQTLMARQGVTVSIDVPAGLELPLERMRVERVFQNLAGNAIEVMPRGGEIRIAAREDGDAVLIEVRDTGPGLASGIREKLFQPFFSHGKKNGLGLGLALSRQSILDHGGDLWAAETEGPGATFCLRLPMRHPAPAETVPG